jgi:sterol desaturase/sphingolipid hydroxylase (fatty acid hydroxylase superfamily)
MPVYLQYYFWLILVSATCFALERAAPWRRSQRMLRRGIGQDLVWLIFNGHYLGLLLALGTGRVVEAFNDLLSRAGLPVPGTLALLADAPLWLQFVVFLLLKDFVEWNIHRLLHNVPWLWEFHKLHHSIEELDWIGNFRFHWFEIIVYKTLSYVPLIVLGVDSRVLLIIAILWTLMLDLNHSNLSFSWGPLRYVLNSSRMHVWHHDVKNHGRGGQNFGQVLSVWDWIFGTAYWPQDREMPERLGFEGMEEYPRGLLGRFFWPLPRLFTGRGSRNA